MDEANNPNSIIQSGVVIGRDISPERRQTSNFDVPAGQSPTYFRQTVEDLLKIRKIVFGGFSRCIYPLQKFDVDTERRFAVLLEDDRDVVKWFQPGKNQFRIYYRHDSAYEPDFVVETQTAKYLCEPK